MSLANLSRMLLCALVSIALFVVALALQERTPGSLLAVSLYKMHLLACGAWMGYWIDRGLFPYSRPHVLLGEVDEQFERDDDDTNPLVHALLNDADSSMVRRAGIVAACIIGICLGA